MSSSQSIQSNSNSSSRVNNQNQGALIQDPDVISLSNILDNLIFYRGYLIVVTIIVTLIAGLYAYTATPIYFSDAMIQVKSSQGSPSLFALNQGNNPAFQNRTATSDEIEIIKSRKVIAAVIERLQRNVNVRVSNTVPFLGGWLARVLDKDEQGLVKPPVEWLSYAWGGERLDLESFEVPNALIGKALLFSVGLDRNWELTAKETGQALAKGQGIDQTVLTKDPDFKFQIKDLVARPDTEFLISIDQSQYMVGSILGSLVVNPAKPGSNLIDLTFQSPDPKFASLVLNTLADVYKQQSLERSLAETEKTIAFITSQLPDLRKQLDASEEALSQFRVNTKIVDMSAELAGLVTASSTLQAKKMALEIKRQEMSIMYDVKHPTMRALAAEINGIEQQSVVLSQRISYLPNDERKYVNLLQNVGYSTQLYVGLLNNKQQLEISQAGNIGNVNIIDLALTPRFAFKPQKSIIILVGVAIGLLLGFLLTQLMGLIEKVVRDPKKLETETGIPNLSILPIVESQRVRTASGDESTFLVAFEEPDSTEVEALRSLRTALLFALSEKPRSKVTLITSAVPSQGKSFISANLAYLFAAIGKRTLLIDADIRKSSSHRYFNVETKNIGLSMVFRGLNTVDDVIFKDVHENLDFLPAGQRVRSPGDLLSGDKLQHLITQLADRYDYVIIDAPPLLPVHDTRTLGTAVDVSLFVARQNMVSLTEVQDAIDVFNKSGNQFDGVIFNGFIPSKLGYRYGYGYGYKYGRDGRYGRYATYSAYGKYTDEAEKSKV